MPTFNTVHEFNVRFQVAYVILPPLQGMYATATLFLRTFIIYVTARFAGRVRYSYFIYVLLIVYMTATFPYVVLIIVFIRNGRLEGAIEGIKFYVIPKWDELYNIKVRIRNVS